MTERLVVEMKELAEKYGARFLTVMLNGPEEIMAYYIERFKHHRIELVNCNFPLTDDMRVPGEGHPNDSDAYTMGPVYPTEACRSLVPCLRGLLPTKPEFCWHRFNRMLKKLPTLFSRRSEVQGTAREHACSDRRGRQLLLIRNVWEPGIAWPQQSLSTAC